MDHSLYLDFPCEQAEIIQEDYLTGQQKGADVPVVTHRQNLNTIA